MFLKNPIPPSPDRRQTPRVRCGGVAKIISLPSEGLSVSGKVLNLSLGGCRLETVYTLPEGTRAEIILAVNAASIRVLGEVRAIRGPHGFGVKFLQVSGWGEDLLDEVIHELATVQALADLRRPLSPGGSSAFPPLLHRNGKICLANLVEADGECSSSERLIVDALDPGSSQVSAILNGEELDLFI